MIENNEVSVLAVDDQSRLTRGENAVSYIRDLVFRGGRFLSTSENIDTSQGGWDLRVKIGEITHGETVRGLRAKVRRGQAGRVLAAAAQASSRPPKVCRRGGDVRLKAPDRLASMALRVK